MQEAVTIDKFSQQNSNNLLVFRVGDSYCCILANVVESIIEVPRLTRLPLSTGTLKGIIDFQNTATPVHCLRTYFSETVSDETTNGVIIVVRMAGSLTGLWVDEALDIISIDDMRFHERDPIFPNSLVTHIVAQDERLLLYLDLEGFNQQVNGPADLEQPGTDQRSSKHGSIHSTNQSTQQTSNQQPQPSDPTVSIDTAYASASPRTNSEAGNAMDVDANEFGEPAPVTVQTKPHSDSSENENNTPERPAISDIKAEQPDSKRSAQPDVAGCDSSVDDITQVLPETATSSIDVNRHDSNVQDEPTIPVSDKNTAGPLRTFRYIFDIPLTPSHKALTITDNWRISTIDSKHTGVDATTEPEPKSSLSDNTVAGHTKSLSQPVTRKEPNHSVALQKQYQPYHHTQHVSPLPTISWRVRGALFSVLLLLAMFLLFLWLPTSGKNKPRPITSQNDNSQIQDLPGIVKGSPKDNQAVSGNATVSEKPPASDASNEEGRYQVILGLKTETYSITVERPQSNVENRRQRNPDSTENEQTPANTAEPASLTNAKPVPVTGPALTGTFPSGKFKQPVFDAHGDIHDWQTAEFEEFIYIVVKGDTLWDIAAKFLGDPFQYKKLSELSHVRDPDWIYPGDLVRIRKVIRSQPLPG
ncbi:MAG: chemotaxis protein CheW [Gammaproteobacteria bacterium]|jgi:purine-binding chemotaxis protein CheW